MPTRKTTGKSPILQVVQSQESYDAVVALATLEKRSESKMGAILIDEALDARKSTTKSSPS